MVGRARSKRRCGGLIPDYDECEGPPNFKELADKSDLGLHVNGSVRLNNICMWANVTEGETCVVENTAYGTHQEFIDVVSRGFSANFKNVLPCTRSLSVVQTGKQRKLSPTEPLAFIVTITSRLAWRSSFTVLSIYAVSILDPKDPDHLARKDRVTELQGTEVKKSTVLRARDLCYRGGDKIPLWIERHAENFSTLCLVRADLSPLSGIVETKVGKDGRSYWTIVLSIEIHFGPTEFKSRIKWLDNPAFETAPATSSKQATHKPEGLGSAASASPKPPVASLPGPKFTTATLAGDPENAEPSSLFATLSAASPNPEVQHVEVAQPTADPGPEPEPTPEPPSSSRQSSLKQAMKEKEATPKRVPCGLGVNVVVNMRREDPQDSRSGDAN
ncbi:hypothetical protein BDZ89DRAFT_1131921 [Hymenopellis radicata]|nr:hypothetical protein BDZ89DRAFT_1131921 [Hymenopellis radicata]